MIPTPARDLERARSLAALALDDGNVSTERLAAAVQALRIWERWAVSSQPTADPPSTFRREDPLKTFAGAVVFGWCFAACALFPSWEYVVLHWTILIIPAFLLRLRDRAKAKNP